MNKYLAISLGLLFHFNAFACNSGSCTTPSDCQTCKSQTSNSISTWNAPCHYTAQAVKNPTSCSGSCGSCSDTRQE